MKQFQREPIMGPRLKEPEEKKRPPIDFDRDLNLEISDILEKIRLLIDAVNIKPSLDFKKNDNIPDLEKTGQILQDLISLIDKNLLLLKRINIITPEQWQSIKGALERGEIEKINQLDEKIPKLSELFPETINKDPDTDINDSKFKKKYK